MRRKLAAIAFVLGLAATAAHAESVTITFSSLASQGGQTLTNFDAGAGVTVHDPNGFLVVGPSSPGYAGQVGIVGAFDEEMVITLPMLDSITDFTVTYAAHGGTGVVEEWQAADFLNRPFQLGFLRGSTAGGAVNLTGTVDQQGGSQLFLTPAYGDQSQILAITLDFTLPVVQAPEPSGLLMGAIGLGAVAATSRVRRRR